MSNETTTQLMLRTLSVLRVVDLKMAIQWMNYKRHTTITCCGPKSLLIEHLAVFIGNLNEQANWIDLREILCMINLLAKKRQRWSLYENKVYLWNALDTSAQCTVDGLDANVSIPEVPDSTKKIRFIPTASTKIPSSINANFSTVSASVSASASSASSSSTPSSLPQDVLASMAHVAVLTSEKGGGGVNRMADINHHHPGNTGKAKYTQVLGRAPMSFAEKVKAMSSLPHIKPNAFFAPVERIAGPLLCTVSEETRGSRAFDFYLNYNQMQQLAEPAASDGRATYQVRFYCLAKAVTDSGEDALIVEFPFVCELKVNGYVLSGSTFRGLKNQPGTVNAPDVTSMLDKVGKNRVELVYANTSKEYWVSVELVQRRTVTDLVKCLTQEHSLLKETVLEKLKERNKDSEIVISYETLSTKCPIGFTRITLPCRSTCCQHLQCYDVVTFLTMNEQTPTWICPVCSRPIPSWKDLVIDCYFIDILSRVPEEVDSVRIEVDGEMHYMKEEEEEEKVYAAKSLKRKHSESVIHSSIVILDDEEEKVEEKETTEKIQYEQKKELWSRDIAMPSLQPTTLTSPPKKSASYVIDLTLDSDDETTSQDIKNNIKANIYIP